MNLDFYNIDLSCNYRSFEDEKESDLVYKKNLVEVFNLQENVLNDDLFELMSKSIDKIKSYLVEKDLYKLIIDLVKKASQSFIFEDEKVGLMLLFSYDFFDDFHLLLKELLVDEKLNSIYYDKLLNKITG